MAMSTTTFSVLFVAVVLCSMVVISDSMPTGLRLDSYSEEQVKGCYIHNQTLGVCFDAQKDSMKIAKTTGEEVVVSLKLDKDMFYSQVLDLGFIRHGPSMFYVPDNIPRIPQVLREFLAMKKIAKGTPSELADVKSLYKEAVTELHYVPEIQLLKLVSEALSDNSTQLEILKRFHVLCFNLFKAVNIQIPDELRATHDLNEVTDERSNRLRRCASRKTDPNNDGCVGMCGRRCDCWWSVCFNCCYNQGCYEHDKCCEKDWDSSYCQEPWWHGFSCRGYGGYPECLG